VTEPRHTADTITDDALDKLYADRDRLRAEIDRAYRRHDSRDALHYALGGLPDQRLVRAAQTAADERGRAYAAERRTDRAVAAWHSARHRATVLSEELTRRAPLLGQYAAALDRVQAVCHDLPYEHARRVLAALDEPKEPRP
jgi:hypothetical protein